MAFPVTRVTLIQRLAAGGSQEDWRAFVDDYWGPVFHFCLRRGAPNRTNAEELTMDVFAVVWTQKLLERWQANRAAKLRTLVCAVARNLIAQRRGRKPLAELATEPAVETSDEDCFYAAWAEDLLHRALDQLATAYRRTGQGDYLRVYLGRTCEGLTIREVSDSLGLDDTKVDYFYRQVRDRMRETVDTLLGEQVVECSSPAEQAAEQAIERQRLRQYFAAQGDLEKVLRESLAEFDRSAAAAARRRGVGETVTRLTKLRPPSGPTSS
jgi:RNA polymerase sigma factor (sigma-70 family)